MKTLLLLLLAQTTPAANPTPDYYLCTGRVGGEWNYGRAPSGCDANAFGSDEVALATYGKLVFQDPSQRSEERKRYMDDLHSVIRDAAAYYIKKRKPQASVDEISAFQLGILTTAAQETYWSHYRFNSDALKMMRGDSGHGHGIMQVDDRHHFPAVQRGLGWNLLGNITYAMDIYFAAWERAPNQACVGAENKWEERIRSAWAAYNGGPAKICRWTNPNDTWARNDQGFYSHLTNQRWRGFVTNFEKAAPINVPCLIENQENCPGGGEPPAPAPLQENKLYSTPKPCVFKDGKLYCLNNAKDHICLRSLSAFENMEGETLDPNRMQQVETVLLDRHATCANFTQGFLKVGQWAEAKLNINLRATPGGGLLGQMAKGIKAEILDFEVRNFAQNRYYKVKVNGVEGFVYGGSLTDYTQWLQLTDAPNSHRAVAVVGEKIQIVNRAGINLRKYINGTWLVNIPMNTLLVVEGVTVQGAENLVYYKVRYGQKVGFIYSGMLLPKSTIASWTKRIP